MSQTIRYHLDENCHAAVAEGLRSRGIDVTTSAEVGLLGARDVAQLAHAHDHGRVFVTRDADLLRLDASGVPHAGIAFRRMSESTASQMIQSLILIWEIYEPAEMANRVEFL